MNADVKKRGLGRGLDALFRDMKKDDTGRASTPSSPALRADEMVAASKAITPQGVAAAPAPLQSAGQTAGARKLPVDKLQPGRYQPRRHFDEQAIEQLTESIRVHGILQPLLVRPLPNGVHEIIGGERRWRAAQRAALHDVPVIVRDMTDNEALEISLIENLQREDLSAIEEAEGYQRLIDEFGHRQEDLAAHLGKSRSHIANTLRLLKLPPAVQEQVQSGKLSAGHARALVGAKSPEQLAQAIIAKGLSVRDAERLVQEAAEGKAKLPKKKSGLKQKDVDVLALEQKMTGLLGMKVTVEGKGPKGRLIVEYKTLDQLDDVLKRLSVAPKRA